MPRLRRLLLIPDCHIPYHDVWAWNLVLKVARAWKPDILALLGDFADCATVSSHSKDPSRLVRFPEEIKAVAACLDQLDALGAKRKIYVEGNHEDRLDRYLRDHAPELCGLGGLTMRELLDLDARGYEWVPYKDSIKIGHLNITHDTGRSGAHAAQHARDTFEGNVVVGHVHRLAVSYSGNAQGNTRVGVSAGWLGDVDQIDYMHKIAARKAWSLGFVTGYLESDGVVHLQAHPIIDYKVVCDGVLYQR